MEMPYQVYSRWLADKYGKKVYKLPIALPLSCPNRDGTAGFGGCIYCGEKGGGNETREATESVTQQLVKNRDYIARRYKAKAFIPYFQSFSNTYCSDDYFKQVIDEAAHAIDDVVGIAIATRPDCINDQKLDFLETFRQKTQIDITIELGLQSGNDRTLSIINRGHDTKAYIEASRRIKQRGLGLCTHVILDLPWDTVDDVIKTAAVVSAVGSDFVKCHALYIEKETKLEQMYRSGEVTLLTEEDYISRCISFLIHLKPTIVLQRVVGRVPENLSFTANWNRSWWVVRDSLVTKMAEENLEQGVYYTENTEILNGY